MMNLYERLNNQGSLNIDKKAMPLNKYDVAKFSDEAVKSYQDPLDSLGFTLSPQLRTLVNKAAVEEAERGGDYDAEVYKWGQAINFADYYKMPVSYTVNNLDILWENQLGQKPVFTQSGMRAISNSFRIGDLTVDRQRAAEKFFWAEQRGEDTTEFAKQIDDIDSEMESLYDYTPRRWYLNLLKDTAQTIPYSARVAGVAGVAGILGKTVGNVIVPGAGTAVGTALSKLGSFVEGYRLTAYGNYYDLRKSGISKEVATLTSSISGGIQAAIESLIGIESGLGAAISGTGKGVAGKVLAKSIANGSMSRWAVMGSQYLINATSEGIEEFTQTLTEEISDNIAYTLSDMDAPNLPKDIIKDSVKAFTSGFGVALLLGLPETVLNNKATLKYAEGLKNDAKLSDSKQAFIKKHSEGDGAKSFDAVMPEGTVDSVKKDVLGKVWDSAHADVDTNVALNNADLGTMDVDFDINEDFEYGEYEKDEKGNVKIVNGAPVEIQPQVSEEIKEPIKRMDDGRLRTQESTYVRHNPDGTESHTINIGSRGTNKRYGFVDYTINEDIKTVKIDKVATRPGFEDITSDAVLEVARTFEGWNIEWNPESDAQLKVKESLMNNAMNQNKGSLQWFNENTDADTNIQVSKYLNETFDNLTREQSVVAARLLEIHAQSKGMDLRTWINNHIQGLEKFSEEGKKGAFVPVSAQDIKGIIYAGKNADFSTLLHESFHALIRDSEGAADLVTALKNAVDTDQFKNYISSHKKIFGKIGVDTAVEAIKSMGDNPLKWDTTQHEVLASLFEGYLRDGKTFSEKLKNIFARIADWFHRIYTALHGEGVLNDDVVKAYDAILAGNSELAQRLYQSENLNNSSSELHNEGKVYLLNFKEQIKDVFQNKGQSEYKFLDLGEVSHVYKDLGLQGSIFSVKRGTIVRHIGKENHLASPEEWITLAENINNPIAYFKDNEGKYHFYFDVSKNNNTLMMIVEEKKKDRINKIENIVTAFYRKNFKKDLINGRVKKINQSSVRRLQSSIALPTSTDYINNVGQGLKDVKDLNVGNAEKLYQTADVTESENFKKWFKDSKVVDEDGKPLIVYHGSYYKFSVFDWKESRPNADIMGMYFSPFREESESYGENLYPVYLSIQNPVIDPDFEPFSEDDIGLKKREELIAQGYDGIFRTDDGIVTEYVAFYPNQIKSATDNNGEFNPNNDSILYQTDNDKEYFKALEENNIEKAQSIVEKVAREKGYSPDSEYMGGHTAPSRKDKEYGIPLTEILDKETVIPKDYFDHPEWYTNGEDEKEAFYKIRAMMRIAKKQNGLHYSTFYRAVPKDIKEDSFRNGDWITPLKSYAQLHGENALNGNYRIITQVIPVSNVIWDGNSILEFGYDDGKLYAYQNTKNNVKSLETITRDENGNIIPPSKRFNKKIDNILYQLDPVVESEFIEEARDFDTKEEYILFEKTMYFGDEQLNDEDLGKVWDKAHGVYQIKENTYEPSAVANMTDDEKDEQFRVIMDSDDGIKAFMQRMRDAFNDKFAVQRSHGKIDAYSDEDYNDIIQNIQNAERIEREAAPFIVALAKSNKDISDDSMKKIRGMINNSLRDYRDLYAQVIGDENFANGVYSEYMPNIKDSRSQGMRITERKDLVKRLEGEEIIDAVKRGTEKFANGQDGIVEKVIAVYDKEISELKERLARLQEQEREEYRRMSVAEQDAVNKQVKIDRMESAIKREREYVKSKLDDGDKVDTTKLNSWEEQLQDLHESIKELRSQDKVKADVTLKREISDLKKSLTKKEKARAAAEDAHNYKMELYSNIVSPVPANVDYEYKLKIEEIVGCFRDVLGYENTHITIDGKKMSLSEYRKAVEDGSINIPELTTYQLKRYLNYSFADLTVAELETFRDIIDYFKQQGRQMWQAKVDKKNFEAIRLQHAIYSSILANKKYKPEKDAITGSVEGDKQLKKGSLKGFLYKTLNMNRKAQILDGDVKGLNYNLLITEKRKNQTDKLENINARLAPVMELMKELGVKEQDFFDTIQVKFDDGMVASFPAGRLAYILNADKNERNYQAVAYGTLVTQNEKLSMPGASESEIDKNIMKLGDKRFRTIKNVAEGYFSQHPELLKVVDAIVGDWNKPLNIERVNRVLLDEYNKPMDVEGFYMPIKRQDFNGTDSAAKVQDDLYNMNAGKSKTTPQKGFSKNRIDIRPLYQQPVDLDIFRVWLDSVEDQENVIANLGYVRKLNRIYKNYGSTAIRSAINNAFGSAMDTDLNNYINEIANSKLFTDTQELNGFINKLRGALYPAYLGFKMSGVILQAITSPLPSLQEVGPGRLAKALLQMSFHPTATWHFITEKSAFMKNRSESPVVEMVHKQAREYTDSKMKQAYRQFLEYGTWGLEAVDRWAVSASWLACYEKKMAELADNVEMSEGGKIKEAAFYADNFIRDTQPGSDVTEIAPVFKSKNAFANAFTQFQVSLNVIWNNVVYDLPQAIKQKEFRKAVGLVFGYALAGALLTAVQDGFGDDDEPEEIAKKLAYGLTTQFTGSVPLLGSFADSFAHSAITGESGFVYNTNQLYPGISYISEGLNKSMSNGMSSRSAKNLLKGVGIMVGVPVSGANEIWQTFFDKSLVEAVESGDLNFKFNPGALLGRRNYK